MLLSGKYYHYMSSVKLIFLPLIQDLLMRVISRRQDSKVDRLGSFYL